jgi:hypothetical protein
LLKMVKRNLILCWSMIPWKLHTSRILAINEVVSFMLQPLYLTVKKPWHLLHRGSVDPRAILHMVMKRTPVSLPGFVLTMNELEWFFWLYITGVQLYRHASHIKRSDMLCGPDHSNISTKTNTKQNYNKTAWTYFTKLAKFHATLCNTENRDTGNEV